MSFTRPFILITCLLLAGCGDDDDPVDVDDDHDLTFTGDATFQGAHGGQALEVAIVRADGSVVETASGTVSATANPSFSFEFDDVLEEGSSYELHYWVDSNFGGGTVGTCDPPANDHQWSIDIPAVSADVTINDTHRPTETAGVCDTF